MATMLWDMRQDAAARGRRLGVWCAEIKGESASQGKLTIKRMWGDRLVWLKVNFSPRVIAQSLMQGRLGERMMRCDESAASH